MAVDIETIIRCDSFGAEPGQFVGSEDGLFVITMDFTARRECGLNATKEPQ